MGPQNYCACCVLSRNSCGSYCDQYLLSFVSIFYGIFHLEKAVKYTFDLALKDVLIVRKISFSFGYQNFHGRKETYIMLTYRENPNEARLHVQQLKYNKSLYYNINDNSKLL